MSEDIKRLQMNFPAELHKVFKLDCLKSDRLMTDVIQEMVVRHLKERGYPVDKFMPSK